MNGLAVEANQKFYNFICGFQGKQGNPGIQGSVGRRGQTVSRWFLTNNYSINVH
jgi:hypothetical protein